MHRFVGHPIFAVGHPNLGWPTENMGWPKKIPALRAGLKFWPPHNKKRAAALVCPDMERHGMPNATIMLVEVSQ